LAKSIITSNVSIETAKKGDKMNYKIAVYLETLALIVLIISFIFYTSNLPAQSIRLSGAGATFPAPLIQKWSEEFHDMTGIQVDYEGIGSGGGINQLIAKTVDFGASDPPMTDSEFDNAKGALHLPITIGGVAIIYNIPGIDRELNFTGEVLADIFRRNITRWNDSRLATINPSVNLPDNAIIVCCRSDSSGTTKVFTSFLSDESKEWRDYYGASKKPKWPEGTLGGKGNTGVAALVLQNQYSIGYVEFSYAIENKIPYGKIQNPSGKFIAPSLQTMSAAVEATSVTLPLGNESWATVGSYFNLHLVEEAHDGYPITSFSYILVYKELNVIPEMTQEKANALTWFLWWIIHDGQHYAPQLHYVPLPQKVVKHNEFTLRMISFNGQQVNDWS